MKKIEYEKAILRADEISRKLTEQLDENGLELFEEYCENYKEIVRYETENKKN